MEKIVYRKARIDEYQKIGKVIADSFFDYPFLTLIIDDLKKPENYPAFLELLESLLTRLYIKEETCLVAEQDGEILAVALLQQNDFSILSYLLNGVIKLFRYISPRNFLKYLDLVDRSEEHLKKSNSFDWYLMLLAVNPSVKGQGVGSALLYEFIKLCKNKAVQRILLEVRADNISAIRLYERHGFYQIDVRAGYYKDEFETVDALILQKDL